ncbi:MAG: protein kinase domain-containing protein, partial [Fimbriiglobus sp.]
MPTRRTRHAPAAAPLAADLSGSRTPGGFVPEVGAEPYPGYRLLRLRGTGGFASVWEASAPGGENVALKFMSSQNVGTTAKELRSLQAVKSLDHGHLLRIRDVWSMHGCIVVSMDLAEASMLDLLQLYVEDLGRPIENDKLCWYMLQVAEALDFLNARQHRIDGRLVGLQHGDIKPNNILLSQDKPMLADYGLATPTNGPITPCPRHGTAEFSAPEVFQGFLTETSDQFSFAVTYFVLRTGSFPYPQPPSPTGPEGLKNYRRPDPDLGRLDAVEQYVVGRALSHIPQQRFASCTEFMTGIMNSMRLKPIRSDDGVLTIERMAYDEEPPDPRK